MNLFINASNLHIGGGVQVAISVIEELKHFSDGNKFTLIVSTEIYLCLSESVLNSSFINVIHHNVYGVKNFFSNNLFIYKMTKKYNADIVWSIFGPSYFLLCGVPHVVGFANAWLVGETRELAFSVLPPRQRFLDRSKYFIQKLFLFFESDYLVTETFDMKLKISKDFILKRKRVNVISNCYSSLYSNPETWHRIVMPARKSDYIFCTIASNYPHKNLDIIADVADVLFHVYRINPLFLVTIPHEQYDKKSSLFKKYTHNFGVVAPYSCPEIYQNSDALFLPTLLETFSASYPEAMFCKKVIFTSDLSFARDVCGPGAFYFDPLDKFDIAKKIADALSDSVSMNKVKESALSQLKKLPNATERLKQYIDIFKDVTVS